MNPYTVLAETSPPNPSADVRRLALLPRVREVTLRGRAFRSEQRSHRQTIGSNSNRVALLAFTRGTEVSHPCSACRVNRGPFDKCVVVNGMFRGSCTNCRFNCDAARCDLRGIAYTDHIEGQILTSQTFPAPELYGTRTYHGPARLRE